MNSVNEAIKMGVPMLVFPMAADQPYVAARILELGIGRCGSIRNITPKKIREISFEIMNDKEIERNVKTMKDDMMKYNGNKRAADIILEYLHEIN